MSYFTDCATVEQIKGRYRDLARQHHPDLGGDLETMKAINAAYHAALKGQDGTVRDERTYRYNSQREQEIMDKIAQLLLLPDLEVSLIGLWVWIQGNTKPQKAQLKELGCIWHSKRGCWYWKPAGMGASRANPGSLSELAAKYGCESFRKEDDRKPARKAITA